jgi:hypothetical protein
MDTPISLNTPKNTIAAIPSMLGHHPKDSVVVLFMEDNILKLTSRMDAGDVLPVEGDLTSFVFEVCKRHDFTSVIVVHFGSREILFANAMKVLDERCETGEGPALIDAMIVHEDGRFRSVAEHVGHLPYDSISMEDYQSSVVAMGSVMHGNTILGSRDEVTNEFRMAKRTNKVHKEGKSVADELLGAAADTIDYRWSAYHFGVKVLDDDEASPSDILALGLIAQEDVKVRDAYIRHVSTKEDPRAIRSKLMSALPHMPEKQAAALLTLVAVSSYAAGDGMRASIALEKCLSIDDGYRLAQLMDRSIQQAVPPQVWVQVIQSMTLEETLL